MVAKSSPTPEIPHGPHRRMPHAVNYLHGAVHYNGGYLVFDDIRDAMSHLDDRAFLSELKRFSRRERRVVTLVLRDRRYDLEELAWFVAFVRARLPWYANGNGPSPRRVLFGVPSPYPSVNLINRSWIQDLHALLAGDEGLVVRPPVEPGRYFLGAYGSKAPVSFSLLERTHAWVVHGIIRARGSQEGLVFSSRRRIEPERFRLYHETKGRIRTSHPVSNPFFRRRSP
jgi:hypothetical protein